MSNKLRPIWISYSDKMHDDYEYQDHHFSCTCSDHCNCYAHYFLATIVWQLDNPIGVQKT